MCRITAFWIILRVSGQLFSSFFRSRKGITSMEKNIGSCPKPCAPLTALGFGCRRGGAAAPTAQNWFRVYGLGQCMQIYACMHIIIHTCTFVLGWGVAGFSHWTSRPPIGCILGFAASACSLCCILLLFLMGELSEYLSRM